MRKITLVLVFFHHLSFASFEMTPNIKKSYSHILNLEFEKADVFLNKEKLANPNNGLIDLHKNYIDFLTIIVSENLNYFNNHYHLKDERLLLMDNNDKASPYYLYSKAEINLQWAFARLKFGQYLKATYEIVKAYKLLEENNRKFPEFTLNNKGLGLIHALLGAVPKDYHWILDLAGLEGNIELGLHELNVVLTDSDFIEYETEILFLVSFLQINLSNNDSICHTYLDRIGDRYQDNIFLTFATARLSHSLGMNDLCLKALEQRPDDSNQTVKFYYLDYLQAMSYLYMLDYKSSQESFEKFLLNFKGSNYIKSANHKLGWIAFLSNNRVKCENYFSKVISDGENFIDEDKVALRDAKRKYITHPCLLRSRLLYDGGYYSLALHELEQIKYLADISDIRYSNAAGFSNFHKVEYWYRLSRIKDQLDYDRQMIIENYEKVLELRTITLESEGNTTIASSYYPAMSALQIGLIYEESGNILLAGVYFRKCLSMSAFDYQRGIHHKAKAALARLNR